jgi:hypothetical protein
VGHPKDRFPLKIFAVPSPEPSWEKVLQVTISEWNMVFTEALGKPAFLRTDSETDADIIIRLVALTFPGAPGRAYVEHDDFGVIKRASTWLCFSRPLSRSRSRSSSEWRHTSWATPWAYRIPTAQAASCAAPAARH